MSLSETRFGGNAPGLPAVLPSLTSALSRRRALFGAVTIAAAPAAALSAIAAGLSSNDARLIALADACEALERACDAHTAEHQGRHDRASEEAFGVLCAGFLPLEEEMAATVAGSLVGVIAKARALQVETCRNCAMPELGNSLADDVWRLIGGGAA